MGIYEDLGVKPIINAAGAVTRLGGAPMPEEALRAWEEAARESVRMDDLQAAASRVLAQLTGAEAGLVTASAAAGLTLGAAAILAGTDLRRIESLPDCSGFPHEFVVAREHRNGYDHAVRAAGARFVEVGFDEIRSGAGMRRVEAWDYEAAFGPATAGVLYVFAADSRPPLAEVAARARARGLPVLVDAAAELPPRSNLRDILAAGADLVVFSGGKAVRGPQSSGILCGRRDLVGSAALQMLDLDDDPDLWDPPAELIDRGRLRGMPRHGIGRALKVSKEGVAALLAALRLFAAGAHDGELGGKRRLLEEIAASLESLAARCRLEVPSDGQSLPLLEIAVDEKALGRSAVEVSRRLRLGDPPVYVDQFRLREGRLIVNPLHLDPARARVLVRRLREELS